MVEAVSYTGSRDPGRGGDRVEHKPKKKKRGLVRSLALRPSVSSTAGSIAPRLPISFGFISHSTAGRHPKGKGVVMSREAG